MEDGAQMRDKAREEYVPVLCTFVFGGTGDGEAGGAEVFGQVSGYRARLLGGFLVCFPRDAVVRKQGV